MKLFLVEIDFGDNGKFYLFKEGHTNIVTADSEVSLDTFVRKADLSFVTERARTFWPQEGKRDIVVYSYLLPLVASEESRSSYTPVVPVKATNAGPKKRNKKNSDEAGGGNSSNENVHTE